MRNLRKIIQGNDDIYILSEARLSSYFNATAIRLHKSSNLDARILLINNWWIKCDSLAYMLYRSHWACVLNAMCLSSSLTSQNHFPLFFYYPLFPLNIFQPSLLVGILASILTSFLLAFSSSFTFTCVILLTYRVMYNSSMDEICDRWGWEGY